MKLKVGKKYRTRFGKNVLVTEELTKTHAGYSKGYRFAAKYPDDETYLIMPDGRFFYNKEKDHNDIIFDNPIEILEKFLKS